MSVTVPSLADLAALAARVTALETRATNNETAIKALVAEFVADEALIAKLQALIAPPPYDPQVLWSAGMETGGTLSEWDAGGAPGSGQVNSGNALSIAVLASDYGIAAHSGLYVMRQWVNVTGGTRIHRTPELTALGKAG